MNNLVKNGLVKAMEAAKNTMAFGIPNTVGGKVIDLAFTCIGAVCTYKIQQALTKIDKQKKEKENSEKASA